jgi:hypothetical protein
MFLGPLKSIALAAITNSMPPFGSSANRDRRETSSRSATSSLPDLMSSRLET